MHDRHVVFMFHCSLSCMPSGQLSLSNWNKRKCSARKWNERLKARLSNPHGIYLSERRLQIHVPAAEDGDGQDVAWKRDDKRVSNWKTPSLTCAVLNQGYLSKIQIHPGVDGIRFHIQERRGSDISARYFLDIIWSSDFKTSEQRCHVHNEEGCPWRKR